MWFLNRENDHLLHSSLSLPSSVEKPNSLSFLVFLLILVVVHDINKKILHYNWNPLRSFWKTISKIYYLSHETWDIYFYVCVIYQRLPLGRMLSHWRESCRRKFWMKASAHLSTSWIVGLLSRWWLPFVGIVTDFLFSVMTLEMVLCTESCCKVLIFLIFYVCVLG